MMVVMMIAANTYRVFSWVAHCAKNLINIVMFNPKKTAEIGNIILFTEEET